MRIQKLNKNVNNKDKFIEIIYKNFLDLKHKDVNHNKVEIKRQIESNHNRSYYLTINNKIVAYIVSENIVVKDGRFTNFIYYLYVSSKHRGKGYSKILLDLINKETKNKVPSIMLIVRKSNYLAQNIYKKYGFIIEDYNGIDHDFIVMIKYH
uniref:N-acetyltransferase domain-containing protein n=1 Tax=viral metagenome TaxID=1070528 RepID=A0A6C0ABV5_9ZZZZ